MSSIIEFPYVAIDTETTGLNPDFDELIEVTAIEFNDAGIFGERLDFLCCPMSGKIPPEASAVNGITMDMVKDKPNYLTGGIREKIASFVGDRKLIGHNLLKFDLGFLRIIPKSTDDTLIMSRKRGGAGGNKLAAACNRYNIPFDAKQGHRSAYDTEKCALLYLKLKTIDDKLTEKEKEIKDLPAFVNSLQQEDAALIQQITGSDLKKIGIVPTDKDKLLVETQAYSFSRIQKYHTCPFQWYQAYVRKLKGPRRDYFDVGHVCHAIAEKCGQWCYRELFVNKFAACYAAGGFGDMVVFDASWQAGLKRKYEKDTVTVRDMGYYMYENSNLINTCTKFQHLAAMIKHIDSKVSNDRYDTPSMPDDVTFEMIVSDQINQNKCNDPSTINDIKKLMYRWKSVKDFSTTPGDIMIFERKLAFDKEWKLLKDFFDTNAFFRGVIDVVDYIGGNTIVITDYKTSRVMLRKDELKEDPQLKMYVLLVSMLLPPGSFNQVIIRIEYIRYNRVLEHVIDDVDAVVKEAKKWIADGVQAIEGELAKTDGTAFQPQRNEYCDSCDVSEAGLCPLFRKDMIDDIGPIGDFVVKDVESCRKAWKRIEANDVENKILRSRCKAFVKQCEAEVKIDDQAVLDIYPSASRIYFSNATVTALLQKGVTIQKILHYANLTDSSMKELMETEKVSFTPEEIDTISKEKIKNDFKALTPKEISEGEYITPKVQTEVLPSAQ